MDPLISIVTPSYQQARYLRACIESVLNQDYPRTEYCVQDGGSTDGSLEILQEYGERFRWTSHSDGGQADAINAGFALSSGQIMGYLNSDDTLMPGALTTVVEAFRANPDVDVIYGNANLIDESDQLIGRYRTFPFDRESFFGDCYICQPATFWRREAFERIGPFNEDLNVVMDYEFWIRIALSGGRFLFIDQVLAQSRDYPETKTRSNRKGAFNEIFSISRRLLHGIHPRWIESYLYYIRFETNAWWRRLIPRSEKGRKPLVRFFVSFSKRCR